MTAHLLQILDDTDRPAIEVDRDGPITRITVHGDDEVTIVELTQESRRMLIEALCDADGN